ncbi:TPA: hypothetical protein N7L32_000665 [Escherichia coli]|nr:hypothetical protein [Escherichia coli]
MKLKHVGIIVVSVLAMSSAAVSAAEGDESVTTTVNGGVIHFKGEVVKFTLKVTMRHLKLKQGVCGMATHTREIHQCSSHY